MSDKLVTVIVLAERAPKEKINEALSTVTSQTHKNLDLIISYWKRDDLDSLQQHWQHIPNIRWIEGRETIDYFNETLKHAKGEIIFYKSVNPIYWFPRHIEHHLDLLSWDKKASWSFSFHELRNWSERNQPLNILNWQAEKTPNPQTFILDEFCHQNTLIPDWQKCLGSFDGGKTAQFIPGLILEQLKTSRVAVPEEITIWRWVDPTPKQISIGQPKSDQNYEEAYEAPDGQLAVKIEYPTIVGNVEWTAHNQEVYNRISTVENSSFKKIAIKRTIGMGDVLLVEPVIRALRKRYSDAEITLFAGNSRGAKDIVEYFVSKPDIVIGIDENQLVNDYLYDQKGYDLRFDLDLSYESRKNCNYVDAYFQVTGFRDEIQDVAGELKIVNPVEDDERTPRLIFEEPRIINGPYVAVELAGSGWGGKEFLKWDSIIQKLHESPYSIVSVSNLKLPVIYDHQNEHNDFKTMINYLRYCEFYIGADNGPMHIASAFGKECFVVAGAALPKYTTKSKTVYSVSHPELKCLHCKGRQFVNDNGQGGLTFVTKCENPDEYACMRKLEVSYVEKEFERFLWNHRHQILYRKK